MRRIAVLLSCILVAFAYGQTFSSNVASSRLLFYDSNGLIQNYHCFVSGPVLTAADGTWSMSIASAGISSVKNIQLQVISPVGSAATSQLVPIMNPNVGSTFSGKVMSGTGILLLGASSLVPATTAATINLEVCGN